MILAVYLVVASAALSAQERPDTVRVPDVRGLELPAAARTLRAAGVGVALVDSLPSRRDAGVVLVQTPSPGPVPGTAVAETLWVARPARAGEAAFESWFQESTGVRRFFDLLGRLRADLERRRPEAVQQEVPDVVGLPAETAMRVLARVGIQVAELPKLESAEAEGTVLRQLPAAGSPVGEAQTGTLWVSGGPAELQDDPPPEPDPEDLPPDSVPADPVDESLVTVPDVRDLPFAEAATILRSATLVATSPDSLRSELEPGLVIAQAPSPGVTAEVGSTVELVVSAGPRPALLTVPDLRGLTLGEARRVTSSLGLSVDPDGPGGDPEAVRVVGQTPNPGTPVPGGSAVAVVLAPIDDVVVSWSRPLGWIIAGLLALLLLAGPRGGVAEAAGAVGGWLRRHPARPGEAPRAGVSVRYRADRPPPSTELTWDGPDLWRLSLDLVPRPDAGSIRLHIRPPSTPEDHHA